MTVWLVIVAAGLGSYLLRISMVVLLGRVGTPAVLERSKTFVVPAAFAALAATSLAGQAEANLAGLLPPLAAIAAAALAAHRTGRPYTAILAGMPVFWALTALLA
ncbi:AzlD domain-containing protein [Pseudofrankia asymbiotica]|uniref:Branched-chain amino acid transporter n=1 Tax=Pseudofrankia asymbiotica TaxID=1834516 RepID=A0A1V2I6Z0_9ACTN|nr:AzlD domain-containing protein [Pseudofrankia asymbiotica]ONH27106.1 hypothetical protein BL253_22650 [Pseudofrankia asymbiotica]